MLLWNIILANDLATLSWLDVSGQSSLNGSTFPQKGINISCSPGMLKGLHVLLSLRILVGPLIGRSIAAVSGILLRADPFAYALNSILSLIFQKAPRKCCSPYSTNKLFRAHLPLSPYEGSNLGQEGVNELWELPHPPSSSVFA